MVHVLLRILVWVLVIGVGYLVFGPDGFDSSPEPAPFEHQAAIFLPPAKTGRESALEDAATRGPLTRAESEELLTLSRQRQSDFWQQQGTSVTEALAGVRTGRKAQLLGILQERGLSREEAGVFLVVVERDRPDLLADRE